MTLHEAIITIIKKMGPMKASQVAWLLNHPNLYRKRDNSEISTSQIYARINKYPNLLFVNENKLVCIN